MDRSVAFILSSNFAGSHFASLMLGSHSKAAHVGEVCHLRKHQVRERPICFRCGSQPCPLFKEINPATADRAFDILFDAVPPGTSLLVDNSKKLQWAGRFLDNPGFRKRFVHLIRDPRALVRRWDLDITDPREVWKRRRHVMRANPPRFFHALFAPRRKLWLYKWLAQNRRITRFLRSHSLDHVVLTYCDLARDPERELRRIMDWLGLAYEPIQIEYWKVDHHGSQKHEYEWVKSEKRRFVDARWKEYLTPAEQESFGSNPDVVAYLADIGVNISSDGLSRRE
jgi:hypothetical protein